MAYAVIRTGGKQYLAEPGGELKIEKLEGEVGSQVAFEEVLLTFGDGGTCVGKPLVPGAKVQAEIVRHEKAKKILVFKKKRRKNYRRRQGHRQLITVIKVTAIEKASEEADNGS